MLDKTWTAMDIERLKRMYADNYSMSQIGAALGTTRNAISGKVMRLGLTGTRKAPIKVKKARREAPRAPRERSRPSALVMAKPQRLTGSMLFVAETHDHDDANVRRLKVPQLRQPEIAERELPSGAGHPVTFEELGPNDCCAPLDDGAHYCGQTKGLNWKGTRSSYCAQHHALFYAAPSQAHRNRKACAIRARSGVAR